MVRAPWWDPQGRLRIPVDAILEPNVTAPPDGGAGDQAHRRDSLDERDRLTRREAPVNTPLALLVGALSAVVLLIVISNWPVHYPTWMWNWNVASYDCPTCNRGGVQMVYERSTTGDCSSGFRYIRATGECI